MKGFPVFVFSVIIFFGSMDLLAQQLVSGGYKISVKKFEQGETAVVCGPKKTAYGAMLLVKSKDKLKGTYFLSLNYMNEKEYIMAVKNSTQSLMNPMLVYNTEKGLFQYIRDNITINEAVVDTGKPMQDQLLVGMGLWLQVKKKLISEK